MKVLVSITTTNKNYIQKIKELQKFKIKETALFLTLYATQSIRKNIYKNLIKLGIKSIPVVHLRSDMKAKEIEYLIKTFKTKMFNTHPNGFFGLEDKDLIKKYKKIIYLENVGICSLKKEINNYAGLCLDISHLHDAVLNNGKFVKETLNILKNYKCGFAHISAIKKKTFFDNYQKKYTNGSHFFDNVNEFDYIKKYKNYLPKYLALEVENSIEEQLLAKKHIEKILKQT